MTIATARRMPLDDGHTRSSPQISPSMATTNAMMPSTAKKSPMDRRSIDDVALNAS